MSVEHLCELGDPRLDAYRDLRDRSADDRSASRSAPETFVVEGALLLQRLLDSRLPIESILVNESLINESQLGESQLGESPPPGWLASVPDGVPIFVLPRSEIHRLLGYKFHRGVLAVARRPPRKTLSEVAADWSERATVVVCPATADAANLGSILRNAAAFGADAVVTGPTAADPFARQAVRVSMGAALTLPIVESGSIADDLGLMRDRLGCELCFATLDPAAEVLRDVARAPRVAIVFGSESDGDDERWVRLCNRHVRLPMDAGSDSLNVASASAVFLYHFTQLARWTLP